MRHYCEADHYCEELKQNTRGDSGCSHGDMPCDYIATFKHQGHWYCELHYDALLAGETLYLNPDVMEANRRI
jgi:hypothetical protein